MRKSGPKLFFPLILSFVAVIFAFAHLDDENHADIVNYEVLSNNSPAFVSDCLIENSKDMDQLAFRYIFQYARTMQIEEYGYLASATQGVGARIYKNGDGAKIFITYRRNQKEKIDSLMEVCA